MTPQIIALAIVIFVVLLALVAVKLAIKGGWIPYSANVRMVEVILQELLLSAAGVAVGKFPKTAEEITAAALDVAPKIPGASIDKVRTVAHTAKVLAKDMGLDVGKPKDRKILSKRLAKMY